LTKNPRNWPFSLIQLGVMFIDSQNRLTRMNSALSKHTVFAVNS